MCLVLYYRKQDEMCENFRITYKYQLYQFWLVWMATTKLSNKKWRKYFFVDVMFVVTIS